VVSSAIKAKEKSGDVSDGIIRISPNLFDRKESVEVPLKLVEPVLAEEIPVGETKKPTVVDIVREKNAKGKKEEITEQPVVETAVDEFQATKDFIE